MRAWAGFATAAMAIISLISNRFRKLAAILQNLSTAVRASPGGPCILCVAVASYCGAVTSIHFPLPLPSLGVSSLDLGRLHPRAALFSFQSTHWSVVGQSLVGLRTALD